MAAARGNRKRGRETGSDVHVGSLLGTYANRGLKLAFGNDRKLAFGNLKGSYFELGDANSCDVHLTGSEPLALCSLSFVLVNPSDSQNRLPPLRVYGVLQVATNGLPTSRLQLPAMAPP